MISRQIDVIGKIGIIPLTQGKYSWIDAEDVNKVKNITWYYHDGYARSHVNKKILYLHRFIMNTPDEMKTDHVDGNKLDNRKKNLRICNKSQNSMNSGKHKNNTSGYKGVYWGNERKWLAQIKINYKFKYLGSFDDKEKAALAYNIAAIKYHGEYAYLNIIKPDNDTEV